ncbi:MAG: T9SS type A sorting domain-containing protein [Bacteroidales bacterium]|nr:T9SS type A sorting domain-containing protein [Bacteroidales bacterium]
MILFAAGSLSVFGQITDDFSASHDYLDGVDGTIWDGVKENGGILEVAEVAEILDLNTTTNSGALTFTTVYSYFAGNNDNGCMIYKNVPAGSDFSITVEIFDGTFPSFGNGDTVDYLMVGPIVRVDDAETVSFVALQAFDRPNWGAVYGFRNIPMDPEENWISVDADENEVSVASHPWMRLSKSGSTVTGSISEDGETWWEYWSEDREDMDAFPLQVGLYNASYTDQEGTVVFDNVSITGSTLAIPAMNGEEIKLYYSALDQMIKFGSDNISGLKQIQVVNMAGQLVKSVSDIDANGISVAGLTDGTYVIAVQTADGQIYSDKVVIF